jgi:hypothetical protein
MADAEDNEYEETFDPANLKKKKHVINVKTM